MIRFHRSSFVLALLLLSGAAPLPADESARDWPEWRGPNRDNISRETGLLQEWPDDGPPLRWQVEGLGAGIDSVSISDGRICTFSFREGVESVTALDQHTGDAGLGNTAG